jgi:hypothetical protein
MSGTTELAEYCILATMTSRVDVRVTDATNETCGGTRKELKKSRNLENSKGLHEFFSFVAHMKAYEKCYELKPISFMVPDLYPNGPAAFCEQLLCVVPSYRFTD